MNYYQFHIADFALHTSHLTLEEEGVYRRLLDFYYDTESPIPTETQPVIRRLRLGSYSVLVEQILSEFFVLEDDGWHNLRADIEIAEFHKKAERARNNGKKGGRPKKSCGVKTQSVSVANPEETGSKANQEPVTNNQEPVINNIGSPSAPVGDAPPPDKPKQSRFVKPTVEQVRAYCLERGNAIDPQKFVDHYEANGWMRGKSKVKDWKACVRTWEGNQNEKNQGNTNANIQPGVSKLQRAHDEINAAAARAQARANAAGPMEADDTTVRPQMVLAAPAYGRR